MKREESLHFVKLSISLFPTFHLAKCLLYGHLNIFLLDKWLACVLRKIGWMLTGRRDIDYNVIDLGSTKNIIAFSKNKELNQGRKLELVVLFCIHSQDA